MSAMNDYYGEILVILFNHPYSFMLHGVIILIATWYFIHHKAKILPTELTKEEEEELINEWQPEPLTPEVDPYHHSLRPRQVSSIYGKIVTVEGKECINLATHNYLGFVENKECLEAAIAAVKKYGVGSCGPRGFFGTVDVHLELEQEIAKFMKTEEAILYSYGYSAISSAIPAYAKVNDIIFVDEGINFSIQQGIIASRSSVRYFKHNDVDDLARLLKEQELIDQKNPRKAKTRSRFLVVEGLYLNYGDICPLREMVKLKHQYKLRLFIDDSCGFGVLGENGRGVVEHSQCDIFLDVDMVAVSLEYASASYGGFCCGTHYIIDHQRLSGLGYCFSASLPPLQAAVGLKSIELMQKEPEKIKKLRELSIKVHQLLAKYGNILHVHGAPVSPIKHLSFAVPIEDALICRNPPSDEVKEKNKNFYLYKQRSHIEFDNYRLEKVVELACEQGYALTVARYLDHMEHRTPEPSIRLTVNIMLLENEIEKAVKVVADAFDTAHQQFQLGEI